MDMDIKRILDDYRINTVGGLIAGLNLFNL